jgi:hypothetical protein
MQNRTYGELFSLIQSLSGVGSFTSEERSSIRDFINRRFLEAYLTSQMWPRYLVVGEERSISASPVQTIPYTESGKNTIGEFIRIHRTQPFLRNSALEFDFYVNYNGAHILNLSTADATSAFVTYKLQFSPFAASPSDSTEVPAEFFYFIAHAAYADFLRMDGQTDKALVEEKAAGNYLVLELEKLDVISNNSTINKRFTTYVNRQSR